MEPAGTQKLRRLPGKVVKKLQLFSGEPRSPPKSWLREAATVTMLEGAELRKAELAQVRHRSRPLGLGQLLLRLSVDFGDLNLIPLPTAHRAPQGGGFELRPPMARNFAPFGIPAPDSPG